MSDTIDSPTRRTYVSHGLFSDHYLAVTLPQNKEWQSLATSGDVAQAFSRIKGIITGYVSSVNEAQTEEDLVKPILLALGHTFEVQPALDTPGTPTKPDYVFYQDRDALLANKGKKLTEDLLTGRAFAIGDAKYWDRPLDVSLKGASHVFSNKNPSSQIEFYMRYSGVTWGILTNGRLWRLYHKDSARRLDRYYEVDVAALVSSDDSTAFVYFYAFFSRRAFEPWSLGVEAILRESSDYAQGVSASLKVQAFDAVRHLAQGFLDYPRNARSPDDATLKDIYGASLILLYRLLFILYAESRGLLPVDTNEQYRDSYSLDAIKRQILSGKRLLATSGKLWGDLRSLFDVINDGSIDMGIATYNGGLFSAANHPFLDVHVVGDHHLQRAIDALARVNGHFVDYRDLAVRHLGTIYEGLLEFHLRPIDPTDGWTIDMRNDKGERHATGSYYTPDYIVTYMVDRTVGPLLRQAVAPDALGKEKTDDEKIEAILALNILDMSMGSGHFLVEGTDYIARFIVDLGVAVVDDIDETNAADPGESDITYWRRRVVQSCIYGVDLNPLAVELAKLSLWLMTVAKDRPLSFLDHHLRPGNALVGSRIASLPTGTTPGGGPSRANKRREAAKPNQLRLFDDDVFRQTMKGAVDSMGRIEAMLGETISAVKEQERLYTAVHDRLTRAYGAVANLATAIGFGTINVGDALPTLVDYVRGTMLAISLRQRDQFGRWIDAANDIIERHAFFHWELEFPEVFFDRDGKVKGSDGGFDVVIGNPPYVRQEALGGSKPYLATAYRETYDGSADLYVYFYQQGLQLTRAGGRMSYIVTNKWMRAGYGEKLRAYFAAHDALESIVDFGHAPIFADADVFPCIIVLDKPQLLAAQASSSDQVAITVFPREVLGKVDLGAYTDEHSDLVRRTRFSGRPWSLEPSDVDDLLEKIERAGQSLTDFAGVKPYYGIKTGLNEAFLINTVTKERLIAQDQRSAHVIKPYLRGQDVKRWSPRWDGLWLILLKSSGDHAWPWKGKTETEAEEVFRATYPSLYQHLKPMEDKLRKRQDKGRYWWELRSCAYYHVFESPKIVHTDITWHPQFAFSDAPTYILNTAYVWPTVDPYVLAVLNSPLLWSYMWRKAMHGKDDALRLIYSFVETLPIAAPSDDVRTEIEPAVMRLIDISRTNMESQGMVIDWLRTEFGVDTPGMRLEDFPHLDEITFLNEVRKRRPKNTEIIKPGALKALREAFIEHATPIRERRVEAAVLEHKLSDLVNQAYGLTPAEVALLWETAPPRMPIGHP